MGLESNSSRPPDPETLNQTGEMLHGVNITAIMAKQNPVTIGFKFSRTLDGKTDKNKNTKQERNKMEAILGAVAFGGLFTMWVVLPSRIRKAK